MKNFIIGIIAIAVPISVCGQEKIPVSGNKSERSAIRKGNKEYSNKNYIGAEVDYRKALEADPLSGVATFNLGDALYKQQKYENSVEEFKKAAAMETEPARSAEAWYNLGNAYMQSKKYTESIDAYKNSLRRNPKDADARYNLRLAQLMMQQQQQEQQDKKEDKKDQQQQQQQQQQNDNKQQNKKDQQQQPQPQSSQMTQENAQQILDAMQQDEKNTQEKVRKAMMEQQKKRKTDKEW
ncbi:MAG: tetratricopeptide repeat protein [Bacteroidales bacterium]